MSGTVATEDLAQMSDVGRDVLAGFDGQSPDAVAQQISEAFGGLVFVVRGPDDVEDLASALQRCEQELEQSELLFGRALLASVHEPILALILMRWSGSGPIARQTS